MNNLYLLIGLPGAGKTTFCKMIIARNRGLKYISSDELRDEFSNYRDDSVTIFRIMHQRTLQMLKSSSVLYDSTDLERKYRIDLYKKAKLINAKTTAIFIHNGLNCAIQQSRLRTGRTDVNEKLIRDMYTTMQIPIIGTDCDSIIVPHGTIQKRELLFFEEGDRDAFKAFVERVAPKLAEKDYER